MQNKKIAIAFTGFICILSTAVYSYDVTDLNGFWIHQFVYDLKISNHGKSNSRYGISIALTDDGIGEYWDGNIFDVTKTEILENGTAMLELSRERQVALEVVLKLLDNDAMLVVGKGKIYDYPWYRVSGPARIPVQNAVLNDSPVRLRVKPNLDCDTWGYLNKGDKVKIKDKSEQPFVIAGESWYWYKVESEKYPDGWIYGKYIDIEEGNKGGVDKEAARNGSDIGKVFF